MMVVLISTAALSFVSSDKGYNPTSLPFSAQSVFAQIYSEAMIRTDNVSNTITELSTITQQATNSNGFGSGTNYNGNQDNALGATVEAESRFNFEGRPSTNAGDQQSSFASPSSTTDFRSFLDSFANSIFNGTAAFGTVPSIELGIANEIIRHENYTLG